MNFLNNALNIINQKKDQIIDSLIKNALSSKNIINKNTSEIYTNNTKIDSQNENEAMSLNCNNQTNSKFHKSHLSMMILDPLSNCMLKIMRTVSFIISGSMFGGIAAVICFVLFFQMSNIENSVLSSYIIGKCEKFLSDVDLSIDSAALKWNFDNKNFEIVAHKVKIDDIKIPTLIIDLDFFKSFSSQKIIAKSVSIVSPKINISTPDLTFKNVEFNTSSDAQNQKLFYEPINVLKNFNEIFSENTLVKLVNASVNLFENGIDWKLRNVYVEYRTGCELPNLIDFNLQLPGVSYVSNVKININALSTFDRIYRTEISNLNPKALRNVLIKCNMPIDNAFLSILENYNVPVNGNINFNVSHDILTKGDFDLSCASGSIAISDHNLFSSSLARKIDAGGVSGSFDKDMLNLQNIRILSGNSELQLTNIKLPLSQYKILGVANIDGTLSISNLDIEEIENLLPYTLTKPTLSVLSHYVPGFKLESFAVDVKGPIHLNNKYFNENVVTTNCVFKIKNAILPIGNGSNITNVIATGKINEDGIDIKLIHAMFGENKINNGVFFISNKDKSWTGKVNTCVYTKNIINYARKITPNTSNIPFEKLGMDGITVLDLKLLHISGDKSLTKEFPFRVVEGNAVIKSDDNTKNLKISWNENKMAAYGEVLSGTHVIKLKINENLLKKTGNSCIECKSKSAFLDSYLPFVSKICEGDFYLKLENNWDADNCSYKVDVDLKDATCTVPGLGTLKFKNEDGHFCANIIENNKVFTFNNMELNTQSNKLSGKMSIDSNLNLLSCMIDKISTGGISAKINASKEKDKLSVSLIGETLNCSQLFSVLSAVDKNLLVSIFMNMDEMQLSNVLKFKNVKGNIAFKGGQIHSGQCYGVLGNDITIAFNAKEVPDQNYSNVCISASDAGATLKYLGITNSINGGNINFLSKTAPISGGSISGTFNVSDFIVKNNVNLLKLMNLTSSEWANVTDDSAIGFNFAIGNFVLTNSTIKISNGKAIGPSIAISYDGNYDRSNDELSIKGISLPMATLMSQKNSIGLFAADYTLLGNLNHLDLSVSPIRMFAMNDILAAFGKTLPAYSNVESEDLEKNYIKTQLKPRVKAEEIFNEKAFDDVVPIEEFNDKDNQSSKDVSPLTAKQQSDHRQIHAQMDEEEQQAIQEEQSQTSSYAVHKPKRKLATIDTKYGVEITRGM